MLIDQFILGGLMGPMIIHGPSHVDYDIDLGPVFLTGDSNGTAE